MGISHYASMLVGWCSVAEIVSRGQGPICRCPERRRDCTDDEPVDVVGGLSRCRGRMVSDVAVENMEGQEEAFRMFTIVGVVLLIVVQCEPTPDS